MEYLLYQRYSKYIISSKSLDEFIFKIKTKRYTNTKLNRMLLHILVNFTKEEAKQFNNIEYIRVLGFNFKGREYLNKIKSNLKVPLVVKFASIKNEMLNIELRSTCVYASVLNENEKQKIIEAEYKNGPIIF